MKIDFSGFVSAVVLREEAVKILEQNIDAKDTEKSIIWCLVFENIWWKLFCEENQDETFASRVDFDETYSVRWHYFFYFV